LHQHPLGVDAACIGEVVSTAKILLRGSYGITRLLDLPYAEPLPRIC